ncbi:MULTISPECIES: hypothetical protein [Flavobacterium]|uniref:DUF4374 domain-containing protein n=1 Tax=Flavobacterium lipolyticum TaxID=2893754 RepID=A0ABS8LW76_9FLAO|nr:MULTISPECIES: hypothetical protein [unclassified Flavobacterium]MCC9016822.1 hypothetical protein [Flavobacterium sp. F-126]
MNTKLKFLGLLSIALIGFSSCSNDDKKETDATTTGEEFVFSGGVNNPSANYMLTAGTLATGFTSANGNGAEITGNGRLFKNGFYYKIASGKLSKYKFEKNLLTLSKEITLAGNALWSYWLNDNTLIVWNGTTSAPNADLTYNIVNTDDLSVAKSGTLTVTGLQATDKAIYLSGCVLNNGKLYLPYTVYHSGWTSTSVAYLASVDYPSMSNLKIDTDNRSGALGTFSTLMGGTIKYNNDLYIITDCGDRWGSVADKPSAIFKVSNGSTEINADYFFDLSTSSNGNKEFYGLYDLGNGKGITRLGKKEVLLTFDDYNASDVFEYYVVDVVSKTKTKLNLPLSQYVSASPVLVENGKAYILVSSKANGNFVYTYDINSGSLTKGIEVKGLDYVNWISRLNK